MILQKESFREKWEYKKTKNHFCSPRCSKDFNSKESVPKSGEKRNELTFIEAIKQNNHTTYKCLCDCGEITFIKRNKFGITKTCNNRINHKGEKSMAFDGYKNGFVEKFDFCDVLIKPKKSSIKSRNDVNLYENDCSDIFNNTIPIIASNIDSIGTFSMAKSLNELGLMTCLHKHYKANEYIKFFKNEDFSRIFYSTGAIESDLEKLKIVYDSTGINKICLDVANAYIPQSFEAIEKIKKIIKNCVLMVGNIATPDIIEDFAAYNVNILKCGIGSGGVCTTRTVTGIGVPQLSCILDCVKEANLHGIKICSDGGCRIPADIVKAFAAGSSMVMIGSMFSGHDECDGELVEHNGKK